jgi:hypothetical protein
MTRRNAEDPFPHSVASAHGIEWRPVSDRFAGLDVQTDFTLSTSWGFRNIP